MKRNRGFTLMEMLIVVAIIAVLAAIAIPVFNGSLHKAKVAADMANVRAYYAELQTQLILTGFHRKSLSERDHFLRWQHRQTTGGYGSRKAGARSGSRLYRHTA